MPILVAGESGACVIKDLPPAVAIGVNNFSPWAAAVTRAGHVLIREAGQFKLLDMSQPPAAFSSDAGLNRAFISQMLADSGSTDCALHDMLCTHGAVYLADLDPLLLLQGLCIDCVTTDSTLSYA